MGSNGTVIGLYSDGLWNDLLLAAFIDFVLCVESSMDLKTKQSVIIEIIIITTTIPRVIRYFHQHEVG